jgi:hypothetical protein
MGDPPYRYGSMEARSRLRDPHHLEIIQEVRRRTRVDPEPFDRRAFARHVLDVLMPPRWTVALYVHGDDFYVDRGRDLRRGLDAVFAIVGVPPTASRAEIALAIAELTGTERVPFVLDLLAADDARAESARAAV